MPQLQHVALLVGVPHLLLRLQHAGSLARHRPVTCAAGDGVAVDVAGDGAWRRAGDPIDGRWFVEAVEFGLRVRELQGPGSYLPAGDCALRSSPSVVKLSIYTMMHARELWLIRCEHAQTDMMDAQETALRARAEPTQHTTTARSRAPGHTCFLVFEG
eukprot:6185851-Pleurochrysis_carterae.AAC.3